MYFHCGKLIKQLRNEKKLSQEKLAEPLMTRGNLAKIENDNQGISRRNLEYIAEKLGHSAEALLQRAISGDEYEIYVLRDELENHLAKNNTAEAIALMAKMEQMPAFKTGLHKQFLLKSKAKRNATTHYDKNNALALLEEAIKINFPSFNEKLVHTYFLTGQDVEIINMMASIHYENGNKDQAFALQEKLLQNIKLKDVDEREKARSLSLVLYNMSSQFGKEKEYEKAIDLCNEAIKACRHNRVYEILPKLLYNVAYCMFSLGRKDEIKHYLRQAYYCCLAIGDKQVAQLMKEKAKENFNIDIEL